jgi:hypothetical protein
VTPTGGAITGRVAAPSRAAPVADARAGLIVAQSTPRDRAALTDAPHGARDI